MQPAELWDYEKLFWKRVFNDTLKSIIEHLGMEFVFAVLGFVGGFLVHDQNAISGFVGALATLGAVVVFLVLKNLVVVPVKFHKEKIDAITKIKDRKLKLEDRLKPKLKIRHGIGGSFMMTNAIDGGVYRIHRIEVPRDSFFTNSNN